jgi:hypothetical protein
VKHDLRAQITGLVTRETSFRRKMWRGNPTYVNLRVIFGKRIG